MNKILIILVSALAISGGCKRATHPIADNPTDLGNCMSRLSELNAEERAECIRFWNYPTPDYKTEEKKLQDLGAPIR